MSFSEAASLIGDLVQTETYDLYKPNIIRHITWLIWNSHSVLSSVGRRAPQDVDTGRRL